MAKRKIKIVLITLASLYLGYLIIRKIDYSKRFDDHGEYVIAKVTRVAKSKSGRTIKGYYYRDGELMEISAEPNTIPGLKVGLRIFLKVLPEDVDVIQFVYDRGVPACYDNEQSMKKIWKQAPVCPE